MFVLVCLQLRSHLDKIGFILHSVLSRTSQYLNIVGKCVMAIDCKLLFKVLNSPELYTVFLVKELLCTTAFEMQLKILSPLIAGLCHRSVHTASGNTERKIGMDVPPLRHKQGWLHQQGGEAMVHVLLKQSDISGETLPNLLDLVPTHI